jgi:hypothetical protein
MLYGEGRLILQVRGGAKLAQGGSSGSCSLRSYGSGDGQAGGWAC